jgi:hypothetical protein
MIRFYHPFLSNAPNVAIRFLQQFCSKASMHLSVDLTINVLTLSHWPTYAPTSITMPQDVRGLTSSRYFFGNRFLGLPDSMKFSSICSRPACSGPGRLHDLLHAPALQPPPRLAALPRLLRRHRRLSFGASPPEPPHPTLLLMIEYFFLLLSVRAILD